MIDLHAHLIPGVDDGARDLDDALAMCREASAQGTTAVVATPHVRHELFWNDDPERLRLRFEELREALDGSLDVRLGSEITLNSESYEEMLRLPDGDLFTLAGSRWVLVELPWRGVGPDPREVFHELKVAGLRAIVAHPERVRWLMLNPGLIEALRDAGARFQLTAASVTGNLGPAAAGACRFFFDAGWADFVASDAHDTTRRGPSLREAHEHVATSYGPDVAQRIFHDHPRAVLADEPLPC